MSPRPLFRSNYPLPLPPDTEVQREIPVPGGKKILVTGMVQRYLPDALPARLGMFPVSWSDGRWTMCGANDVVVPTRERKTGAA